SRFYLIGNHTNEEKNENLKKILRDHVFSYGEKKELTQWTFHFEPFEWKEVLLKLISDYMPMADERVYYKFDEENCKLPEGWKQKIKDDYRLELVNKSFLERYAEAKNIKDILYELSSWTSHEVFFQNGFGFCLVNDKTIASWCLGEYVSPKTKRIEVGIETYENYQKQGFATVTGAAMVDYAINKGYTVGWHCWESNKPSAKTAEKIGYEFIKKYPVLFSWYNKIDSLLVKARWIRTQFQEYELAVDFYNQVIQLYEKQDPIVETSFILKDINVVYIFLAETHSQQEDANSALDFIQKAIDNGFSDIDRLERSEQLEPLKTNSKWLKLIEKKE
ncbi:MAG: GNAT family N-acetyltransferase, partial [Candidatus Heimdallarchaeota archaeon]|nr:GNAT family N-acetyltransferase [Candidatus Heimdallarchaeota archaeon]MCK4877898.1 GNAT family N-acetyltransferase [Candidatus Heimdallarchaeota archaeon]